MGVFPVTRFVAGGVANNGVGEPKRNSSPVPLTEIEEIFFVS
jgi:hypothetical protein